MTQENILKKAREAKGLTQMQVAVQAGISLPTVQRAEASNKIPSQPRVRDALLAVLGLTAKAG